MIETGSSDRSLRDRPGRGGDGRHLGSRHRSTRMRRRSTASIRTARTSAWRASSASRRSCRARPAASISGQAALMNLAGDTPPKMAVVPTLRAGDRAAALGVRRPRRSRAPPRVQQGGADATRIACVTLQMDSLRKMLHDAEAYGKAQDAYAKDKSIPRPAHDVVLDVAAAGAARSDARDLPGRSRDRHSRRGDVRRGDAPQADHRRRPARRRQVAAFLKQHNVPVIVDRGDEAAVARRRSVRHQLRASRPSSRRRA